MEAQSPTEVVQALAQRGLFALEVERTTKERTSSKPQQRAKEPEPESSRNSAREKSDPPPVRPRSLKAWSSLERALYLRQLQVMFSSGIGIHLATEALAEQAESRDKKLVDSLHSIPLNLSRGQPIWKALEQSGLFRPSQIAALAIGQESGRLQSILTRLADDEEHRWKLRSKVSSKLLYPSFLLVFISLGLGGLGLGMSRTLHHHFPLEATDMAFLHQAWTTLSSGHGFLGATLLVSSLAAACWTALQNPKHQRTAESLILIQPLLGPLVSRLQAGALARHLALMLESGLSLDRSLALAQEATVMLTVQDRLAKVREDLRHGLTLTEAIARNPVFPKDMEALLAPGEVTGTLENCLKTAARFADFQTECAIESALATLEPLSVAFVGIVSAILILATFSPFYQHLQTL